MKSTAEQILDCAHALLVERGYNGFSYADIAQQIGLRKPSIHHHFPAKADLGRAVVMRYRADVRAMMASAAAIDPLQQLQGYIGYWEVCIREQTTPFCVCAMLAAEIPSLPAEVSREVRGHFEELSQWVCGLIARGVRDGRFKISRAPALEADCFIAMVHGAMLAARASGDWTAFGSVAQSALAGLVKQD